MTCSYCRAYYEFFQDASQLSKLFCKYEVPHPYHYLQPLKTEVQNLDPYLCIYHDMLHQSEMNRLMAAAQPFVSGGEVFSTSDNPQIRDTRTTEYRDTGTNVD